MGGNGIEKDIPAHLYVEVEIVKIACIQVCARNSLCVRYAVAVTDNHERKKIFRRETKLLMD